MAEPVTIAKGVATAAKLLLAKDEEGNRHIVKVVWFAVAVFIFVTAVLYPIVYQIAMLPDNLIVNWALPESIQEIRDNYSDTFTRPSYSFDSTGWLSMPCAISNISNDFGIPVTGGLGYDFHSGIDFPVAFGSSIVSPADGTVAETGMHKDYAQYVMIRHELEDPDTGDPVVLYTFYAHLYKVYVREGQKVTTGQEIALSGGDNNLHYAGNSTGAHLHFEIRLDGTYASCVDPKPYLFDS